MRLLVPRRPAAVVDTFRQETIGAQVGEPFDLFLPGRCALLVEESDWLRFMMAKALRRRGYTVLEAKYASQALWMARRYRNPIDLLVADTALAGITGGELASLAANQHPGLITLFWSKWWAKSRLARAAKWIHKLFLVPLVARRASNRLFV